MAADDDERTEEPTQRKLDDARSKGDIVYSAEVGGALSLLATTLLIAFLAGPIANALAHNLVRFLQAPDQISADPEALRALAAGEMMQIGAALGMAALTFALTTLAARYLQDVPTFTGERLSPKLDKLNPLEGFKRIYGKQAISSFVKSLAKFAVVGAALVWALWPSDVAMEHLALLDPRALLAYVQQKGVGLMIALVSSAAAIALMDYIATRQSYMQRHKMSRREIKEEMRQSEGDPMVKMKLRQIRNERARQRMLANVPKATVVVTNPTHYAIALRYVPEEMAAPVCLAKGVDEVAAKIREAAAEHDIPLIEDPPLARALFASADIDAPIPREHYEAVAKVIGVVMRLAQQRRRLRTPPNRRQ